MGFGVRGCSRIVRFRVQDVGGAEGGSGFGVSGCSVPGVGSGSFGFDVWFKGVGVRVCRL